MDWKCRNELCIRVTIPVLPLWYGQTVLNWHLPDLLSPAASNSGCCKGSCIVSSISALISSRPPTSSHFTLGICVLSLHMNFLVIQIPTSNQFSPPRKGVVEGQFHDPWTRGPIHWIVTKDNTKLPGRSMRYHGGGLGGWQDVRV